MKKEFLTPSMNITSFDTENVVTASGGETNRDYVSAELNTFLSDKTKDKVAEVLITW